MERVLILGNQQNLVGIASEPDAASIVKRQPAVLLLNAGLLHRVGPYRLYVDLARELAASGFYVLRFDAAGIGDSLMHKDLREYDERVKDDIMGTMDVIQKKKGINEFVLIGLCSGADNAHAVAANDKRVSGMVLMDGYTYPTFGFYIRNYGPYIFKPVRVARFVFRYFFKMIKRVMPGFRETDSENRAVFERTFPPRAVVSRELGEMVNRDVNMLYIYSGGILGFYNYAEQFTDMFKKVDFKGQLKLEYFKDANHTYTSIAMRRKLINCICGWMHEKYVVRDSPIIKSTRSESFSRSPTF